MKWTLNALVLMAAMLIWTVGCGGDAEQAENGGSENAEPADDTPEVEEYTFPADRATATITGKILFEGDPPPPEYVSAERITAANDEFCELHHKDAPVLIEDLIVSSDGAIRNVVVYVKKFPEDWTHATPTEPVLLNQKNCTYSPHVVGVMVNQPLLVTSSDDTAHNVHLVALRSHRGDNFAQAEGDEKEITFSRPEAKLGKAYFICDIHGWMKAWVAIFDHPFHAVTGDDGSFDLGKLPPGEYTIAAWHETLGEQEIQITLQDGGAATADFTFQKEE